MRSLDWIAENSALSVSIHQKYSSAPHGTFISSLLANVCLHPFDGPIARAGKEALCYADDFAQHYHGNKDARQGLTRIERFMKGNGLIHPCGGNLDC